MADSTTKPDKPEPKAAEPKPKVEPAPDKPAAKDLAPAGESGHPDVQKLLAERQAHASNAGLDVDPALEAVRKDAKEAIEAIDEKLADLGYTAK